MRGSVEQVESKSKSESINLNGFGIRPNLYKKLNPSLNPLNLLDSESNPICSTIWIQTQIWFHEITQIQIWFHEITQTQIVNKIESESTPNLQGLRRIQIPVGLIRTRWPLIDIQLNHIFTGATFHFYKYF